MNDYASAQNIWIQIKYKSGRILFSVCIYLLVKERSVQQTQTTIGILFFFAFLTNFRIEHKAMLFGEFGNKYE